MSNGNGWTEVALGDILSLARRPVPIEDNKEYEQVTVRIKGRGLDSRGVVRGSDIATKRQFQVRSGDLLVSKIDARNGGLGLVPDRLDRAIVSGDFPAYTVDASICLPEYLDMYVKRPVFWDECLLVSEGSTNRVRLVPDQFLELVVQLPALDIQRRSVEAVGRLIAGGHAMRQLEIAARRAHAVARVELIDGTDDRPVQLADVVVSVAGGKSPKCLDRPPADGEFGVLKVSSIRDGEFFPDEAKTLPKDVQPWKLTVRAGDLLYSRANTSALVGAMCRVRSAAPHLLLCDKTMRVEIDDEQIDPDYLVEAMGIPSVRDHIEAMAGGTSESMKNISQASYLEAEIPLPDLANQRRLASQLCGLRELARSAAQRAELLSTLTAALIEDLVTGVRQPPAAA